MWIKCKYIYRFCKFLYIQMFVLQQPNHQQTTIGPYHLYHEYLILYMDTGEAVVTSNKFVTPCWSPSAGCEYLCCRVWYGHWADSAVCYLFHGFVQFSSWPYGLCCMHVPRILSSLILYEFHVYHLKRMKQKECILNCINNSTKQYAY